jgi:hypothetical protein
MTVKKSNVPDLPQNMRIYLGYFACFTALCLSARAEQYITTPLKMAPPEDWQVFAQAQDAAPQPAPSAQPADAPMLWNSPFFANWTDRVRQAQASQPHWISPLVTVTPMLIQQVRYDQYWEHTGTGANVDTYFSGQGLELIPTTDNEVLLKPPSYIQRTVKSPATGWSDDPFLTIKQRLLSANEQDGNYIVTAYFGATAPTGSPAFTNDTWILTPTLGAGKGWGDFDVQATIGAPVPLAHQNIVGTAIVTNVALQYHISQYLWPEFEFNNTYWANGLRGGKNQLFLTPGIVFGRFVVHDRNTLTLGTGYQFAVSPPLTKKPVLTPTYNHAWILSARLTF